MIRLPEVSWVRARDILFSATKVDVHAPFPCKGALHPPSFLKLSS